jgi:GNAT superfamily N-acetyltransferase
MSDEQSIESRVQPDLELTYRSAAQGDTKEMAVLVERARAKRDQQPLPLVVTDKLEFARISERIRRPGAWTHLAYDGSRLVGFVAGDPTLTKGRDAFIQGSEHLGLLMVDPEYWGRGIGGQLLDWAAEYNRGKSKKHIELWTQKDNVRARALYERKGYYLTGAEKRMEDRGVESIQYQLDL